ncbi:MAG: accessory factor UbiK family protein [Alphaproteobacteria bacterium]
MQTDNRLFDDLARLAGGAFSSFTALKDEAESRLRVQIERILVRMDLVRRDEFDAVRAMAIKAREENVILGARIETLESRLVSPRKAARSDTSLRKNKPRLTKKRGPKEQDVVTQ